MKQLLFILNLQTVQSGTLLTQKATHFCMLLTKENSEFPISCNFYYTNFKEAHPEKETQTYYLLQMISGCKHLKKLKKTPKKQQTKTNNQTENI